MVTPSLVWWHGQCCYRNPLGPIVQGCPAPRGYAAEVARVLSYLRFFWCTWKCEDDDLRCRSRQDSGFPAHSLSQGGFAAITAVAGVSALRRNGRWVSFLFQRKRRRWVVVHFKTVGFCFPASAASNASASASNASASRKRASAFPFRFAARSRSLSGSGTCRFRIGPLFHRMRPVSSTDRETARQKTKTLRRGPQ